MSVNLAIIVGNLGGDPQFKIVGGNTPLCEFSVATNYRIKDGDDQWTDETTWHNVKVWGKDAENCNRYLKKGREVYVEGRMQTDRWNDKETGKTMYKTYVVAKPQGVRFLSGGRDDRQ